MWSYQIPTGKLTTGTGVLAGVGYSGHGSGKNNAAMCNVHGYEGVEDAGPLPTGYYTIKGPPTTTATHGPYVLTLAPDSGNEMFGRDGFLIHGDSIAFPGRASLGCIVLPHAIRVLVWASGDFRLWVKA